MDMGSMQVHNFISEQESCSELSMNRDHKNIEAYYKLSSPTNPRYIHSPRPRAALPIHHHW